ncbi:hypothetical protein [Cytobacillus oceanisediminis]|uniref:hypothetical protein n=1 Tax=Cytobacillus oceanisediminis TaxID=665099 RepID=UPI00203EDBBB|nr:hypothetical protein [Cytobacillus oceanisediminis]MCM3393242.1 hypothetical protein [Cytobacillus oceanisediminis]
MNTLLSAANAALQYNRGKQTGLAGLVFIGIVLLAAYQWDHIVPIFEAIGLISFLDQWGLIYEGESYMTGFSIFMVAFRICILFVVLGFLTLVLGIIFSMIGSSNIGAAILGTFVVVLALPFILLWSLYDTIFTPKEVREERKRERMRKYKEANSTPIDIIKENYNEITEDEAIRYLNRIPTKGDHLFLLGVTEENEVFFVFPKPYYLNTENFSAGLWGIKSIMKRCNGSEFGIGPFQIDIKPEEIYPGKGIQPVPIDRITFYHSDNSHKDIKAKSQQFSYRDEYRKYIDEIQSTYFQKKDNLEKTISITPNKERFNEAVQEIVNFNASNEEIVRMMIQSEGRVQ